MWHGEIKAGQRYLEFGNRRERVLMAQLKTGTTIGGRDVMLEIDNLGEEVIEHQNDYASKQFGDRPYFSTSDKIYYLDETNGSDENDGLTQNTAFKTWAKCFSKIPIFINHFTQIRIIGNYMGEISIYGIFSLQSTFCITGDTENAENHVVNITKIEGCNTSAASSSNVQGMQIQHVTIPTTQLQIGGSMVSLINVKVKEVFCNNSNVFMLGVEFSGDGNGLFAYHGSRITSFNASGTVGGYGLYAMYAATIVKRGPQPTGGIADEHVLHGGVIR